MASELAIDAEIRRRQGALRTADAHPSKGLSRPVKRITKNQPQGISEERMTLYQKGHPLEWMNSIIREVNGYDYGEKITLPENEVRSLISAVDTYFVKSLDEAKDGAVEAVESQTAVKLPSVDYEGDMGYLWNTRDSTVEVWKPQDGDLGRTCIEIRDVRQYCDDPVEVERLALAMLAACAKARELNEKKEGGG